MHDCLLGSLVSARVSVPPLPLPFEFTNFFAFCLPQCEFFARLLMCNNRRAQCDGFSWCFTHMYSIGTTQNADVFLFPTTEI
uniref:Uncharacterized protein n=1 Tax=viral metagenome TaxID=1070528 RepID=A0A6C0KBS2_9ZZZZ